VDVINGLAARYCVRQDIRGFVELWGLLLGLAGAAFAIFYVARTGVEDRVRRTAAFICAGILTCLMLCTAALWFTIFRWCYLSAAASLGMAPSTPVPGLDAMICLNSNALATINGWILVVVSCVAAIGLLFLGIFRMKRLLSRAISYAGAAVTLLFAVVNGFLIVFGTSWCQSHRLF